MFTHIHTRSHTEAFNHRSLEVSHAENFHIRKLFTHRQSGHTHTHTHSQREAFAQTLLHTKVFTYRRLYMRRYVDVDMKCGDVKM